MINEPVRMLADYLALNFPTDLAAVTIEAGDTRPSGITITDSTRDPDVAVGRPSQSRGISVALADIKGLQAVSPTATERKGQARLLVRWEMGSGNAAKAMTDAGYGIRAVLATLQKFWRDESGVRTRNGVSLFYPLEMEITALQPRVETEPVMAGIFVPCEVCETFH